MKPLSPRAAALLAVLKEPLTLGERLFGLSDERRLALAELRDVAELAAVPGLLPLVFGGTGAMLDAAAPVLDRALAAAAPADLLRLDEVCRRLGWAYDVPWESAWRTLKPSDLSGFGKLGAAEIAVLGVASFHANGHVREATVSRLDTWTTGRELPFLLVRLNDWVPAIASRAMAAVERRVESRYAAAWLAGLPLLLRLGAHTRRSAGDLIERVLDLLLAPEQSAVLQAGLASADRTTRRTVFRLLRQSVSAPAGRADLVATALRDPDPVVRIEAVAYARQHFSNEELEALLPTMLADPYPPVRRDALAAAAERLGERADPWLVAALLDRRQGVRELARFHLARRGVLTEFAAHYREQLDVVGSTAHLAAAIAGLGETGSASDVPRLLSLLVHERPSVRRAVVWALGRLDGDGQRELLLTLLGDASPGVTHAVRDVLLARAGVLGAGAIRGALQGAGHTHGRLDALALAAGLSKWESIVVPLEATASSDDRVRSDACGRVAAWVAGQNRSFVQPSAGELGALRDAVGAYGEGLPGETVDQLRGVLRYWGAS